MLHRYSKPCRDFLSSHTYRVYKALCDLIPAVCLTSLPLPSSALVTSFLFLPYTEPAPASEVGSHISPAWSALPSDTYTSRSHFIRSLLQCSLIREVFLDHSIKQDSLYPIANPPTLLFLPSIYHYFFFFF